MFRMFGFPVEVRAGFVIFIGLIIYLYQNEYGLWLAAGLTVFTLLHELGHAVVARSAGATASISLSFLAGYTSFQPAAGRPISLARRASISVAGPGIQIAAGVGVLLALGVNPLDESSVRTSATTMALWWSGPVIGVLNLIPVLPLDGGRIAEAGIEAVIRRDATRPMAIVSLALTLGFALWLAISGDTSFVILLAFLLLNQMQILQATSKSPAVRQHTTDPLSRMVAAESQAWQTGTPGPMALGQQVSPWFDAYQAIESGNPTRGERYILDDLRASGPRRWIAPLAANRQQLATVVDVLPDPMPDGNLVSQQTAVEVMLATGRYDRAGRYAVQGFNTHRSVQLAAAVARAAAATGDEKNSQAWLLAAINQALEEGTDSAQRLGSVIDQAPELTRVRERPEIVLNRQRLG